MSFQSLRIVICPPCLSQPTEDPEDTSLPPEDPAQPEDPGQANLQDPAPDPDPAPVPAHEIDIRVCLDGPLPAGNGRPYTVHRNREILTWLTEWVCLCTPPIPPPLSATAVNVDCGMQLTMVPFVVSGRKCRQEFYPAREKCRQEPYPARERNTPST